MVTTALGDASPIDITTKKYRIPKKKSTVDKNTVSPLPTKKSELVKPKTKSVMSTAPALKPIPMIMDPPKLSKKGRRLIEYVKARVPHTPDKIYSEMVKKKDEFTPRLAELAQKAFHRLARCPSPTPPEHAWTNDDCMQVLTGAGRHC